jgi:hypothetical protein
MTFVSLIAGAASPAFTQNSATNSQWRTVSVGVPRGELSWCRADLAGRSEGHLLHNQCLTRGISNTVTAMRMFTLAQCRLQVR